MKTTKMMIKYDDDKADRNKFSSRVSYNTYIICPYIIFSLVNNKMLVVTFKIHYCDNNNNTL